MQIEHWVEILYPGSFVSEWSKHQIPTRDVSEVYKHAQPGMFGFSYFDVEVRSGRLEDGTAISDRKTVNKSGMYYPGGVLATLSDVVAMGPEYDILASNMEFNNYPVVVKTRRGNFQPFGENDRILADVPAAVLAAK